ncbi:hypothetical protein GCM10010344_50320 [Streptomyces bluensis]|nr:hypothetical protein GCM10010344_50320 [Streptomyces bluensis]
MKRCPPVEITLPWKVADGPPVTKRLVFTGPRAGHVGRTFLNEEVWKRALASWVIPERKPGESYAEYRENGMRLLRHFYASVLLDAARLRTPHAFQPGTHVQGRGCRLRHGPVRPVPHGGPETANGHE